MWIHMIISCIHINDDHMNSLVNWLYILISIKADLNDISVKDKACLSITYKSKKNVIDRVS